MRVLIALPGLHRVNRGAEVALENVGRQLVARGAEVTLVGSGEAVPGRPYRYRRVPAMARERFTGFPSLAPLHHEFMYEDLTFAPGLALAFDRSAVDVTMTCNYPYTSWALRAHRPGTDRPAHVYVTQNGDWPALGQAFPSRWFRCDGLVCTNPVFYERNKDRWRCALIPNGVDVHRFFPGPGERERFGLPAGGPVVLMVSALREGKRVDDGIRAVARTAEAHLVVAGDGPRRVEYEALAAKELPGRHTFVALPADEMPALYRSADAFLHMTRGESFGNVYIEAMRSGVPVVAHAEAVTEWITDGQAHLVDSTDLDAVARAIGEALRRDREPLVELAQAVVGRFSWEAVGQAYHEFLAGVVRDHQASRAARPSAGWSVK